MRKSIITKLLLGGFLASTVAVSNVVYGNTSSCLANSTIHKDNVKPCTREIQQRLEKVDGSVDFRKIIEDVYQEHMRPYAEIVMRYRNLFSSVRLLESSGVYEHGHVHLVGIDHKVLGNLKRCQETGYLRLDNTPALSEDYFDFINSACNSFQKNFFKLYFQDVHTIRLSDYQIMKLYERHGSRRNPNLRGENIFRISGTKFFEVNECDLGKYFKNNSSCLGFYSSEDTLNYDNICNLEKFMEPIKIKSNTLIIPDWLFSDLSKNTKCASFNKEAFIKFMKLIDVNSVKHIIVFSNDLNFKINVPME